MNYMKKTVEGMGYYTPKETKELLKKHNITFEVFDKWMYGQTCPIQSGELCYYSWDVDRFIRYKGDPNNEPFAEWD